VLQDRPSDELDARASYGNQDGLRAQVFRSGDDVIVAISGDIDLAGVTVIDQAVLDACGRGTRVIIDMAASRFIDSTGLAALVRAHRHRGPSVETLALRSVRPEVRRVFEITGVDRLLPVLPESLTPRTDRGQPAPSFGHTPVEG
jgi:anti-sigma B factor antagonist